MPKTPDVKIADLNGSIRVLAEQVSEVNSRTIRIEDRLDNLQSISRTEFKEHLTDEQKKLEEISKKFKNVVSKDEWSPYKKMFWLIAGGTTSCTAYVVAGIISKFSH